jgi:DNA-binding SARP family transcriptional activator
MVDSDAPNPLTAAPDGLSFRILGPVQVLAGGAPVELGGPLQRALLARLVLEPGQVVARERLIDDLWEEKPPAGATRALETKVSRLRSALGSAAPIVARGGGYAIEVDPGQVDAERFRALVAGAERDRESVPERARAGIESALALWRGAPLGGVPGELLRAERARLEERRLEAVEMRIDLALELGGGRALLAELLTLHAEHPLRERITEQLMLCQYRAGRQAEALETYRDSARYLRDEVGLEPGPRLRDLERAILDHDPGLGAPSLEHRLRRHARSPLGIAVGCLAVGTVLAAVLVLAGGGGGRDRPAGPPLGVLLVDARTGSLRTATPVGDGLGSNTMGLGYAWAIGENGVISQVEARSGKLVRTIPVGVIGSMGVGAGGLWLTDIHSHLLQRIDPLSGVVNLRTRLPTTGLKRATGNGGIVIYRGSLWIARGGEAVDRLDPVTLRRQARIPLPLRDCGIAQCSLAAGDGRVWVAGGDAHAVVAIDAATNRVVVRARLGNYTCCIAAGAGSAWVVDGTHLVQLSAAGRTVRRIRVRSEGIGNVSYAAPYVFAVADSTGELLRIDTRTGHLDTFHFGNALTGVAAAGGQVVLSALQPQGDVTAGLGPKVLRVGLPADYLNSSDPASTRAPKGSGRWQWQLHRATCAGIYRAEEDGPARELTGVPRRSPDGLVWRFPVPRRLRFAPPVGRYVTAADARDSIVRALAPRLRPRTPAAAALRDVRGVHAFRAGRATGISGVAVDGDTLVIRTTRPVHDLPERLALPYFCVLPAGMPAPPGGLPDRLPTAGPYYVSARGNTTVLRPNPGYAGPRPRRLDGIVFDLSIEADRGPRLIARGDLDVYGGPTLLVSDRVHCRARRPTVAELDLGGLCL